MPPATAMTRSADITSGSQKRRRIDHRAAAES